MPLLWCFGKCLQPAVATVSFGAAQLGRPKIFGALIRVLKSARASGVFKADSQNSDVCAEVIMRTLNDLLLAGFCRRWREGAISIMAQAFDGAFETWSSIWDTSA